ncbi:hypothetical protein Bbelb_253270 [Branchiostoma belcheri]|nr:hypothetical protein Bbelb_253270 [Branchiostoma belcheri]
MVITSTLEQPTSPWWTSFYNETRLSVVYSTSPSSSTEIFTNTIHIAEALPTTTFTFLPTTVMPRTHSLGPPADSTGPNPPKRPRKTDPDTQTKQQSLASIVPPSATTQVPPHAVITTTSVYPTLPPTRPSSTTGNPAETTPPAIDPPSWSASSEADSDHSADRADINTRETADAAGGWAAANRNQNQWLMRDLGHVSVITGVITKGRNYSPDWPHGTHDQYVTTYIISYGNENGDEKFYTNAEGQVTVFPGNVDRDTEVINDFGDYSGPISARFIKLHPRKWHGHISIRAKIVTGSGSVEYQSLGCWRDTSNRAIPTLEGTDPRLDNSYPERNNPIQKCYQDGGQCFGSADAQNTYKKYGPSTACAADGEGGPWANEVYLIKETAFSCEGGTVKLFCSDRKTLLILDANYGRTSASHSCACSNCRTDCRSDTSLAVMRAACQGNQQCTVTASDDVFGGDPCNGVQKYLEVSYRCISERNVALEKTADSSPFQARWGPEKAVDGFRGTNVGVHNECTHTNEVYQPWWKVDLEDTYTVNRVSILNRGDCCGKFI